MLKELPVLADHEVTARITIIRDCQARESLSDNAPFEAGEENE
jgi:hypothetical protein